jgi:serine/threonine protein kinase
MNETEPSTGKRYKQYDQLGAGGHGAVFRAYDSQLRRWVAIKRLLSSKESESADTRLQNIRREAETLASLNHANVVTLFDIDQDEEGLFVVMELIQGPDLKEYLKHGMMQLADFKQLAEQSLEALAVAHLRHIQHRDLKPSNIKIIRQPSGQLQIKLIDFGIARLGIAARKQTENLSGNVYGSIHYMAPEQLCRQPTDVRSDLYSLGCIFYEALSSVRPFHADTVEQIIQKKLYHEVVPLGQLCPHLPTWLAYWVMRLMAKNPQNRPSSATEALTEHRHWQHLPHRPYVQTWWTPPAVYPAGFGYGLPGTPTPLITQPQQQQQAQSAATMQAPVKRPPTGPRLGKPMPRPPSKPLPKSGYAASFQRRSSSGGTVRMGLAATLLMLAAVGLWVMRLWKADALSNLPKLTIRAEFKH